MLTATKADQVGIQYRKRPVTRGQGGFTIVELMIALSILAVILVTASALMVRLGSAYTKGVNMANLQSVNRNIVADIHDSIQFGGVAPSGCSDEGGKTCATDKTTVGSTVTYSFCIGTDRYSYIIGRKLGSDINGVTTPHVLWRDSMQNNAGCPVLDLSASKPADSVTVSDSGYEMVGANMRLTRLYIQETTSGSGIYTIQVWMAYGDNDLINIASDGAPTCQGGTGSQYCALSRISTTVAKRVN